VVGNLVAHVLEALDSRVQTRERVLAHLPPTQFQKAAATLETTQAQMDGFFSQVPFKCYLPEVASVGD
jgi:hypothetical protein